MSATVQREIDKQKKRGKARVKQTAEVFTPMDLCLRMVREIPLAKLRDPDAKFLDNSCGDGNFLVALTKVLSMYHDKQHVLDNMVYGVDLMPDNVVEAKRRLGLTPEMAGWHHVVCADGLTYDYEFAPPPPVWSQFGYPNGPAIDFRVEGCYLRGTVEESPCFPPNP